MVGQAPIARSAGGNLHKKSQSSDIAVTGWSCFTTVAIVVVTGSLTIFFAIVRFGGYNTQQEPIPDADVIRKLEERPQEVIVSRSPIRVEQPQIATPVGYFFEIGHSSRDVWLSQRSRHLEKKGWSGICAVPFPGDFSGRNCKVIALPVSGTNGEKVMVEDCESGKTQGLQSIIRSPFDSKDTVCSEVEANTISIGELLSISAPPSVIDYIHLDTNGKELDILNNFPFNEYCSRSWTVKHNYASDNMFNIRHILEVAQGCRVREGAGEYWARCPCERKVVGKPVPEHIGNMKHQENKVSVAMLPNGHAKPTSGGLGVQDAKVKAA